MPTQTGTAGNDYLEGTTGVDTLIGLTGDDIYIADQTGDQVVELAGEGNDIVYTSTSYVLAAGSSVETLAARDNSLTTPALLTGNEIANILLANNGKNYLDGGGGADIMAGYGGDDTYVVDNSGDAVFESAGGGNDTIYTTASFTLGAGQAVERLAARDNKATSALTLIGNEFANAMQGNAGNNFIDGGGGADVMQGFAGDDIYIIDNSGDRIVEPLPGMDIVYVTLSYSGGGGAGVALVSTIDVNATTNIDIRWEAPGGVDIHGNNGNNVLDSQYGPGSVLTGFGGADTFVTHGAVAMGASVPNLFISDFVSGVDKLRVTELSNALPPGPIDPSIFVVGTAAGDFDDRFVYNPATGLLGFDSDGAGPSGMGYVAGFFPGTVFAASDIIIA